MSVTVFLRTKQGVRRYEPGKRWLLLPVLFLAGCAGVWHQARVTQLEAALQLAEAEQVANSHQGNLAALKDQAEAQVSLLAARLGQMQARVNRLEALGTAMAERAELADQFDFNAEVGIGGVASESQQTVELDLLLDEMDDLLARLERSDDQLELLESLSLYHHIDNDTYLSGRPVEKGWQSSSYGYRNDPFTGRRAMHRGFDFAGKEGDHIIATGAGVVSFSGERYGYGNLVEIDHGNGLKTRYGHNKENLVVAGQVVTKGEAIAVLGNTGRSTGPHVHYEVLKNDKQVDPNRYVYRKPKA